MMIECLQSLLAMLSRGQRWNSQQASQESTEIQHYRFGQALWNLIPIDISSEYLSTDKDFFYWVDNTKVIDVFYQHFVEPLDTNS